MAELAPIQATAGLSIPQRASVPSDDGLASSAVTSFAVTQQPLPEAVAPAAAVTEQPLPKAKHPPVISQPVTDYVMDWRGAHRLIFPQMPEHYDRMYRLVNQGAKVRGSNRRIRLDVYPTPSGMAFTYSAVVRFVEEYQAGWNATHSPKRASLRGAAAVGSRQRSRREVEQMWALQGQQGLRRCAPEEKGTYPPAKSSRRTGSLRFVGGDKTASKEGELGRHVDVTA